MQRGRKKIIALLCVLATVFLCIDISTAAGTETIITAGNSSWYPQLPRISSDRIVWQEVDTATGNYGVIFLYNITSGVETQVTDASGFKTNPAIDGNLVAFTDCGPDPFCNSPSAIYEYNIASGTTTRVSSLSNYFDFSQVSSSTVVWMNNGGVGNSQIFVNGTVPGTESPVSPSATYQNTPAIYGSLVAWQESRYGSPDIFLYNLTAHQEIQITNNTAWNEATPAIYGNRIVWWDTRNGDYEIFINGTTPGGEYSVSPGMGAYNPVSPAISGSWVAWSQNNPTTLGNSDIFVNNTSSAQTTPVILNRFNLGGDLSPSISYSPAQSLYRIVWNEQVTGGNNVHLYTSGTAQTCPVANFTNDFAGGGTPITVHFSDSSSQDSAINHWYWDFGDGSTSTIQNPAHTYSANGGYTVSLTVSDPYCRNTTTITNDIIVGAPVAGFTASPLTAVVNVPVSFTDTSLGSPSQWNWSWGDGNWTNGTTPLQQNPSYTYSSPRVYTVALTVTNSWGSTTITKNNYITILAGTNVNANTAINGIIIQNPLGQQFLVYNYTTLPLWTFNPNSSVLDFEPLSSGFHNISITTSDPGGFHVFPVNTTIAGTISHVHLQTNEIIPTGFSASTGGPFSSVNYSIDLSSYPMNAALNTQIWEGATASDAINFNNIASGSHFAGTNGTAYTTKIIKTNFPMGGTAILHMSLNASWVASKPLGRNEVFVERIYDSGAYGQVLGTHFLYYNSTSNLDYFEADSPNGLSTFGLSFLEGAGNLFQLITLTVSNQVQNQVHYAGSGSWSQQGNAPDTYSPTAVQTQVVPQATQSPSQTAAVPPSAPPNAGASPPAPTAVSTDVGIIGWLAETFGGHIYLVAAVAIVVVSLLYIRQRRRRFDPLG
ncbi:MAG: PKD domain-containing protein [Methanoregula sp.]